ncbi:MAG TPA: prevent-host-death protein [Candidatus Paceibacterota bacterium]|nr:prevent-host-death protein [Verrucomicrobiota bacterium]HRY50885.1 prevent-host-death protein [Candidatus Paceibacterota bacterium]
MKYVSVGAFKAQFSTLLQGVAQGEPIGICYGRRKKPVAILISADAIGPKSMRPLGHWASQMCVRFEPDFAVSDEEFLHS